MLSEGKTASRFPFERNRSNDKKSRKIKILEQVLIAKVYQLLRNLLWRIIDQSEAERKPEIQPNSMGDDLGREAMTTIKGVANVAHAHQLIQKLGTARNVTASLVPCPVFGALEGDATCYSASMRASAAGLRGQVIDKLEFFITVAKEQSFSQGGGNLRRDATDPLGRDKAARGHARRAAGQPFVAFPRAHQGRRARADLGQAHRLRHARDADRGAHATGRALRPTENRRDSRPPSGSSRR